MGWRPEEEIPRPDWSVPEIWRQAFLRMLYVRNPEEIHGFRKFWPTTYWLEIMEVS